MKPDLSAWAERALLHTPASPALFERALTHASHGGANYERLEFLGDRVLGLVMAAWLFELHPNEPEGNLSKRINSLVSREACAEIGRAIGVQPHLRLGKQAREDGAGDSENVVGDVIEALIGALFVEGGFDAADRFVRSAWADLIYEQRKAPQHPKSALQEWAAANNHRPPVYTVAGTKGPHHAPTFEMMVTIPGKAEAIGEGSSKQEAEKAAASALLEKVRKK